MGIGYIVWGKDSAPVHPCEVDAAAIAPASVGKVNSGTGAGSSHHAYAVGFCCAPPWELQTPVAYGQLGQAIKAGAFDLAGFCGSVRPIWPSAERRANGCSEGRQ